VLGKKKIMEVVAFLMSHHEPQEGEAAVTAENET
jgi:hypothetical protein